MGLIGDLMGGGKGGGLVGKMMKKGSKAPTSPSSPTPSNTDDPGDSYHSGGRVKKTGPARLKKGEQVLTKTQFKKLKAKGRKGKTR